MEDLELYELKELKKKLITKAYNLIEKLKKQEDYQQTVTLKLTNTTKTVNTSEEIFLEQDEHILCEISRRISGIIFENIDKKWLHDNVYKYTAYLKTKALSFYIELIIKLKDEEKFEICDITCHFINIDKCYMMEIELWVQIMTKMKSFAFLTSAISQYNDMSTARNKILEMLKAEKYIDYEQCTDENGGILIYIHSTKRVNQVYLIIQWSLMFLEQTWKIENHFIIESTEIGVKFAEENNSLLKKFCKLNIARKNFIDLWNEMRFAVDLYEEKS
ncbi:hypothetical protein WN48_08948 [Eufriesea mexicana]|uniref:Uncharacterized protein n=1 Tax=Eufriesea mexicana TaxID=516756 RepID=A0A310S9T0_9HYME|nr:PREDICTED: uncharacterized protein LOC108554679 [Eufriesea mexicana]OAD46930.1 hypothetical protein WN48_08948 [Eufriesea mexicana]